MDDKMHTTYLNPSYFFTTTSFVTNINQKCLFKAILIRGRTTDKNCLKETFLIYVCDKRGYCEEIRRI